LQNNDCNISEYTTQNPNVIRLFFVHNKISIFSLIFQTLKVSFFIKSSKDLGFYFQHLKDKPGLPRMQLDLLQRLLSDFYNIDKTLLFARLISTPLNHPKVGC